MFGWIVRMLQKPGSFPHGPDSLDWWKPFSSMPVTCDVCEKVIDMDVDCPHYPHDKDTCTLAEYGRCDCDSTVHSGCCPDPACVESRGKPWQWWESGVGMGETAAG